MVTIEQVVIVLLLCTILASLSWKLELLTFSGSIASFAMGLVLGIMGGIGWLLLLIIFALIGFVVTRYKLDLKSRKGLQEGRKGERSYRNVLANGFIPTLVAIISFLTGAEGDVPALVYISAICVAAADTTASEMGVLSDKVRLITTLKKVSPGVDGGISWYGSIWATAASVFAAVAGWIIIIGTMPSALVIVPIFIGVLGCMIDSVIGATLETKGWVNKLGNNISSMAIGAVLSLILLI